MVALVGIADLDLEESEDSDQVFGMNTDVGMD